MAKLRLEKLRLEAGMSRIDVALAMGTSQPTYERWESGHTKIPARKLKKLAGILGTTIDEILGRPAAFDLLGIDGKVGDDRTYFGEVAIHFPDKNALLLPISEATRAGLYHQLQGKSAFIVAESLDNRIVFVRREAVADIYFSSEAFGNFGPQEYRDHMGVLPDDDFWHIVEHMDTLQELSDKFDDAEVHRVLSQVGLEDDTRKGSASDQADRYYDRATNTCWQFLSGQMRREYVFENETLFETFSGLEDPGNDDDLIFLPVEGYHRSIFIRKSAISYISIPKHKFNAARAQTALGT